MTYAMLIAPDSPTMDRAWIASDWSYRWVDMPEIAWTLELDPSPFCDVPPVHQADLMRLHLPGWRILLKFWIDSRLFPARFSDPPELPPGYVMPGCVVVHWPTLTVGESVRVCQVCYSCPAWGIEPTCIGCIGSSPPGAQQG